MSFESDEKFENELFELLQESGKLLERFQSREKERVELFPETEAELLKGEFLAALEKDLLGGTPESLQRGDDRLRALEKAIVLHEYKD